MPDGAIVLTGATGILGSAFTALLPPDRLICLGRAELDAADPAAVTRIIAGLRPALVINCAADTDVEGSEAAPERAFAVNLALAEAVASGAAASGARMVHMSSTGCYGDWKAAPYEEGDDLRPTTVHHRSKAEGEAAVLRADPGALILRLGWLFGGRPRQRKNFVWARLVEAQGKREIGSNPRQTGNPTAAAAVAAQAMTLVEAGASGVVNCVGGGAAASRLDYVAAILHAAGSPARAIPVEFARRAPVSPNEAAVNRRLATLGLDRMADWRTTLAAFVHTMAPELTA